MYASIRRLKCLSVHPSVRPSVRLSVCLSVCMSVRSSVCPSVRLSVCLSVRPSVCLSVCLYVWLVICSSYVVISSRDIACFPCSSNEYTTVKLVIYDGIWFAIRLMDTQQIYGTLSIIIFFCFSFAKQFAEKESCTR